MSLRIEHQHEPTTTLQNTNLDNQGEDEESLNTPLAVKLRKRGEKPVTKKKLSFTKEKPDPSEDEATDLDQDDNGKGINGQDPGTASSKGVKRILKKVRFQIEVFPIHPASKVQPWNPKIPPPPPPPPPPPGFFDKAPESRPPKWLPPLPVPPLSEAVSGPCAEVPPPPPVPLEGLRNLPRHPSAPLRPSMPQTVEPIFTAADDGETHVNRTAFKLYTKFVNEIAEFVELQNTVTRKRVAAQEKRMYLKVQRAYIRQCDIHLIEQLRSCLANDDLNDEDLTQLFATSQKARDDVVPLEDHYEALELELGADEYALKEKLGALEYRYERFFTLHGTSISTAPAPISFSYEPSTASSECNGDEKSLPRDIYRAAVGPDIPVGNTPINFTELREKTTIETKSAKSQYLPRIMKSDGSSETLSLTHGHETSVAGAGKQKTRVADADIGEQDVPQALTGIGDGPLEGEKMSIWESMFGITDPSLLYENPHNVLEEFLLDPTFTDGDPILLRGSDGDTQSTLSDYLLQFESTRDRVNKWLLHKLRVSPREVFELQRQVQSSQPNAPDWANLVLDSWHNVGTGFDRPYTIGSETATEQNERVDPFPSQAGATRSSRSRKTRRRKTLSQQIAKDTIDLLRRDIACLEDVGQGLGLIDPMFPAPV